jgi:hypothetical protein
LTARTLCGWLIGIGLMQAWMAWEQDWGRVKLGTTMLVVLPFALFFQLVRFRAEVQWSNPALWVLLIDVSLTGFICLYLWLIGGSRAQPG